MTPAIQIREVHKSFGLVQALRNVSLEIAQGDFFALLGPNGAGKTTLINVLAGLSRADHGKLAVMGFDVVAQYREARRVLGVVPQELVFDLFSRFARRCGCSKSVTSCAIKHPYD